MLDWRHTSEEIAIAAPRLVVVPLAAIEQHGPHLPLASDLLLMDEIAARVGPRLGEPCWLLPTFPYGTSLAQAGFAGTCWLAADTLLAVVRDVVESLYAHGVERVAVLNNHGRGGGGTVVPFGNFVVKTAVRQLNYDHPERTVLWVQPFAAAQARLRTIFGDETDVHAGAIETSLLLHLRPDLVGAPGPDHRPPVGPESLDWVPMRALCPDGVWGRPAAASAERGAAALAAIVDETAGYLTATFARVAEAKASRRPASSAVGAPARARGKGVG